MNIGLDYDGTVTADPDLWHNFMRNARERGHNVCIVTMRNSNQPIDEVTMNLAFGVFYTGLKAKKQFMLSRGINISVWIDDMPNAVFTNFEDIEHQNTSA